jgi:hypothetical protein
MQRVRRHARRWLLAAAALLIAYVASLGLAVGSPTSLGAGLPSCGSPLRHGITFNPHRKPSGLWSGERPWPSSPWCAAARTERAAENLTMAVLALMLGAMFVWLGRRRAAARETDEPTAIGGGVLAALLGPVAMLVGLMRARNAGTRRMLQVQLVLVAAVVPFAVVASLGAWLAEHTAVGGGASWRLWASLVGGFAVLGSLPMIYPLTLVRRRTRG